MGHKTGDRLGQYVVGEQIGEGGMAQVFDATHKTTDQAVAIKLLLPDAATDPQIVARFLQEGRALQTLTHPSIVRVFACERSEDGTAYMAMELVKGTSLRPWLLSKGGKVEPTLACSIALKIADAMTHVHQHGIVHRDLKPENIMLTSSEADLPITLGIKLVDFGIARVPPAQNGSTDTQVLTEDYKVLGTLQYMAPEQSKGNTEVTAKADVYALGVMLFEMITGELPFNGDEIIDFISNHNSEDQPVLRDKAPEAPEALGVFISSMLDRDPKERPTMHHCHVKLEEMARSELDACPLPDLQPFTEAQAELFFGRRDETDAIVHLLDQTRTAKRHWVQVEGPSGVGKSSLVQAGVRRRLEDDQGPDGPQWLVVSFRPLQNPLRGLANALFDALSNHGLNQSKEDIFIALREDSRALHEIVAKTPPGRILLLVIEQMEELFTSGVEDVDCFDNRLADELSHPESPLRLLTTLRSDFLHRLELMPGLRRLLKEASRYHIYSMDGEVLKQVILRMAKRAGLRITDRLTANIIKDTASTDCPLPLLGHALHTLWSFRGEPSQSIEQRYKEFGGVGGALAGHVDRRLESLNIEDRERAKWIIIELIQVGRGAADTRRSRIYRDVLAAAGGDRPAEEVLELLSGARVDKATTDVGTLRLLVLSNEQGKPLSEQNIDLIHNTLLQQVPIIVRWIKNERPRLECYSDMEAAAVQWDQNGRRNDELASVALLERYGGYAKKQPRPEQLFRTSNALVQEFLTGSDRRERRNRWIKQAITAILVVATVVTFMSAIYAFDEKNHAEENLIGLIKTTDEVVSSTDWKTRRNPGNLESRKELLMSLDKSLDSLSTRDRQKVEIIKSIIKTKHQLGDLELYDGTLNQADDFYHQARAELDLIPVKEQSHDPWRELLALNYSKLGKIAMARNKIAEAQAYFEKSLDLMKLLSPGEGTNRSLATSYEELASVEIAKGRQEEAALLYDEAVKLFSKLEPSDYHRSLLAEALCASAATANRRKNPALAEQLLARAKSTVPELPVDTYSHMVRARIYFEFGVINEAQNPRMALYYYQQASALGETLHLGDPTRKIFMLLWVESLQQVTRAADASQEPEIATSARNDLGRAFEHFVVDKEDIRFQNLGVP
jgi:eukaryotic-like serine/threonine-protein kinase